MELIKWYENFETGYQRIDLQHKNLVRLINELFNTLSLSQPEKKLQQILNELYNYTVSHFSLEEAILREYGYKEYDNHKKEHMLFITKVKEFRSKLLKNEAKINMDLLNFLKDWLLNHILKNDKAAFAEIQEKLSK